MLYDLLYQQQEYMWFLESLATDAEVKILDEKKQTNKKKNHWVRWYTCNVGKKKTLHQVMSEMMVA